MAEGNEGRLEALQRLPLVDYWRLVNIKLEQTEKEIEKSKKSASNNRNRPH